MWLLTEERPEPRAVPFAARVACFAAWMVVASSSGSLSAQEKPSPRVSPNGDFFGAYLEGEKLLLEVPEVALGVDFLVYQENTRDQQILRLERRAEKVLLLRPRVRYASDSPEPYEIFSRRGWIEPILMVFPIEDTRDDGSVVIDVSRLFTTEMQGFPGAAARMDPQRSFVETVQVFPRNLEIDARHTRAEPSEKDWERPTARVHWSVAKLPENPMRPRLFDPRMGFWMETHYGDGADYSTNSRGSITRWRLDKKDPSAELSEPVKPIVFYIDPAMPKKWWRYIRQGVESWQPAFEAAGFKNAILAKDPPDDPTWSVDDIRHSVIRWYERIPRDKRPGGATAHTVIDLRTGEILKANAYIPESHDFSLLNWYFTMVAPLDRRAQQLPLPDSLMGTLYQFVVTHEIGHALGLRDGSYGKLAYPTDSLRSESFLRRMGFTPSIMNYARFNYVAQPEDSIPPDLLHQRVGPADVYSMVWGYKPIPGARTPEDEKPTLDAWAMIQDTSVWYRWTTGGEPYTVSDAVDDADPVRSTGLGMKNLRRVVQMLPDATLSPGGDNKLLEQLYFATLKQWQNEMERVVAVVGGFSVQHKSGSQSGPVYAPFPAAQQRAAVAFLDTMAFRLPKWLVAPEITSRFEPTGAASRVMALQAQLLSKLLNLGCFNRLTELEMLAKSPGEVYALAELLGDVRKSLWAELTAARVTVDSDRQSLQQTHLVLIRDVLKAPPAQPRALVSAEFPARVEAQLWAGERALLRAEISVLRRQLDRATPRASDRITRAHLELMRQMIEEMLESG